MIGEAVEASVGPRFGITGLAAAACGKQKHSIKSMDYVWMSRVDVYFALRPQHPGNLVADVVGVLFTGTINRLSKQVVPDPMLTPQQETFQSTLTLNMAGQVCLRTNAGRPCIIETQYRCESVLRLFLVMGRRLEL